ncbi:replication/maintenance protein RepL [Undibacterium sp. MH2W]|uniref:replication/maintenance protein RepL n=1 Tax=Undibacterium sp. MH2W TaxID=3413044 RepID=UPI003BF1E6CD
MTNVTLTKEEEERGNQSQGWLQSDKSAHIKMWQLGLKHPSALAVLHFMISKLKRGANGIVISAPALARQMGISERTAKSATAILRDMKFVQILKSGNTNVYIVNSKVAWQGNRGMRYASFNAQLLVDEQEQVKSVEELGIEAGELIEVPQMDIEIDVDAIQNRDIDNEESDRQQKLI